MSEEASRPEIYPRYCFHLEQHAGFQGEGRRMVLCLSLTPGPGENFYKNLPIKWVRVVGVVVAIDEFAGRRIFTVDDSSGACIEALVAVAPVQPAVGAANADTEAAAAQPRPPHEDIDVGAIIDVKGGLSTFRDEKQIKIERVARLRGTAPEVALWEKRARFRRDVLDKPWVLRSRDIRRCRREAERSDARRSGHLAPTTARSAEAHQQGAKPKQATRSDLAADLKEAIRSGAVRGKYNALGL